MAYCKSSSKKEVHNIKKQERSQIYNLTLHLKELEKVQTEIRTRRRKETIKIRAEINKIVNRKTIEKINQRFGS